MTATEERPPAEVGSPRRRKEDARLITGRTRWTDNIVLPGMLHLAMLRSPFAHARITSVDTTAAAAAAGVVTVLTGAELKDEQGGMPFAWTATPEQKQPNHPAVAVDEVNFAGEVVAVVVARSTWTTTSFRRRWTPRRPPRTRCSRTRTSAPTCRRCTAGTPPRPAPAGMSTRRSRRPATAAS
jgi:xanthine dehydrogenase molybdopterin-binding subunit B